MFPVPLVSYRSSVRRVEHLHPTRERGVREPRSDVDLKGGNMDVQTFDYEASNMDSQ